MSSDLPTAESPNTQQDKLLDHEYDEIREYDNPLPRWWTLLFWCSFWFAAAYLYWYHMVDGGQSVQQEYAADLAAFNEAEAKRLLAVKIDEAALDKVMASDAMMADAQGIWAARCVVCHDVRGQGKIGPNLTDNHWIHGKGKLMDIYEVVSNGVAAKGMPAWNRQLSPAELTKIVAFVGRMRDTNVPGKAPEGQAVGTVAAEAPTAAAQAGEIGGAAGAGGAEPGTGSK